VRGLVIDIAPIISSGMSLGVSLGVVGRAPCDVNPVTSLVEDGWPSIQYLWRQAATTTTLIAASLKSAPEMY
jgi:hypothetical protein